jgi:hypothetical protein
LNPALPYTAPDVGAGARVFDTVFCCRSGSWVPAWCDDQWWAFCQLFPGPTAVLDDALHHSRWDFDHPGDPRPGLVARARRLPPASVHPPTRAATSTPGHADAALPQTPTVASGTDRAVTVPPAPARTTDRRPNPLRPAAHRRPRRTAAPDPHGSA